MAEKKEHPKKKHDTPYTDEPGAGETVERDDETKTPYTDEPGAGETVERDDENETPYTESS